MRIVLARTEQEFALHREDSVDAQLHKKMVKEKEQGERRMSLLREELRSLKRKTAVDSLASTRVSSASWTSRWRR